MVTATITGRGPITIPKPKTILGIVGSYRKGGADRRASLRNKAGGGITC